MKITIVQNAGFTPAGFPIQNRWDSVSLKELEKKTFDLVNKRGNTVAFRLHSKDSNPIWYPITDKNTWYNFAKKINELHVSTVEILVKN